MLEKSFENPLKPDFYLKNFRLRRLFRGGEFNTIYQKFSEIALNQGGGVYRGGEFNVISTVILSFRIG